MEIKPLIVIIYLFITDFFYLVDFVWLYIRNRLELGAGSFSSWLVLRAKENVKMIYHYSSNA